MVLQSLKTLDPCISKFADFFRIELFPFFLVEPFVKGRYISCINEVDEGIAYVALVLSKSYLEVNWQVKEVINPCKLSVESFQKHLL